MERIKVSLPDKLDFYTTLKIRITDLNYGGHVGNDVFLSLVHEARQQYLQNIGYTELTFEGVSLIMADAAIEYKRELKYGDEVRIFVAASGIDRLGFDIFYRVEVQAGEEWLVAGKVKTGMLCFDYITKKKVSVPKKAVENMGFL